MMICTNVLCTRLMIYANFFVSLVRSLSLFLTRLNKYVMNDWLIWYSLVIFFPFQCFVRYCCVCSMRYHQWFCRCYTLLSQNTTHTYAWTSCVCSSRYAEDRPSVCVRTHSLIHLIHYNCAQKLTTTKTLQLAYNVSIWSRRKKERKCDNIDNLIKNNIRSLTHKIVWAHTQTKRYTEIHQTHSTYYGMCWSSFVLHTRTHACTLTLITCTYVLYTPAGQNKGLSESHLIVWKWNR